MILERLRVEGFRHLAAPYEFLPDERLTIVSAPNGTGKSTLLDALYHGLLEKHTVTGTLATERFASRGRDLVPRIVIDFRAGDMRYRLRKHFLCDKLSRLERWEAGRYIPLKEGVASDDFVRELFAADAPGRGALDIAKHCGLAHILWSPSGVHYTAVPNTAGDHVRAMLSDVATATIGERAVEEHVEMRYKRYFTETGAFARSTASANLPAREDEIEAAKAAVDEAAAAVTRLEDLRRSHEDSSWEARRLSVLRAGIRKAIEESKQSALLFDELTGRQRACAGVEEQRRAQSNDLHVRIDAIADLRLARAALASQRGLIQKEIDAVAARLAASTENLLGLTRSVDDASAQCRRVQMRAADVTAAQAYATALDDLDVLNERIAATDAGLTIINDLKERRSQILAPATEELKRLREADIERRNLEVKIAAAALILEITPAAEASVEILIGDGPRMITLPGGNAKAFTGLEHIVLEIPGFGRIKASGPDSAAAARRKHAPLAEQLRAVFERFGVSSMVELEARSERATALETEIQMRQRSLSERLRGEEPAADRRRLLEVQTRVEAIASTYSAWRENPPDAVALRADFDCELRACADAENAAKSRLRAAQEPHGAIRSRLEAARASECEFAHADLQQAFRLDALEADGRNDARREAELMQLSLEWNAARAGREQAESLLSAYRENPHDTRAILEAQEVDAGQQYEESHGRAQRDLALLEEYSHRGSYRRWAEAEETLAALTEQRRVARAEADAIRLLWNAFVDVRKRRIEAVLAPVEIGATRYLSRIAGASLGPIQIARDLTPLGVSHGANGALLQIESTLSAGEREQIFIATRFAIADVIAGTRGRQLFVLDDILTATDPGRLRRFVTLLEELSRERLQIIVTTADASRYLGIRGAKHVDLRAALSIGAAA